jgi:hypothetical protein
VRIASATHTEVPAYLNAMDMLCAPSQTTPHWREQFGRMLVEAMACGVPVLGSDSGEIPFVVSDAGRVLPERNVGAWVKAIEEQLGDAALRRELSERGRRGAPARLFRAARRGPVRRVVSGLELLALRLLVQHRFRREPLDRLLARADSGVRTSHGDLALLERDVLRVERLLPRLRLIKLTCLYRSLARYALLRRHGFAASFVMGIDAAGLVEVNGAPFAEPEDVSRYRVTYRYP